jgi:SAM-dependent methyltransferase
MKADSPVPEINVDKLMHEIREATPRRNNLHASASSIGIPGATRSDLEEIATELGRIRSGVDPPALVQISLPETDWQSFPTRLARKEGAACHFRDLLLYEDADFVQAAYQAILKREPDDEGLRCYLAMLGDGAPKTEILHRIRQSPEGRQRGAKIGGLRLSYVFDSISRWPIIGRAIAIAVAIWNLPGTDRSHRRLLRDLAHRLSHNEQHSAGNARTFADALRRLEYSQNVLADMTKLFATGAHSDALQMALTRTVASLQALQKTASTHVDQSLFEDQVTNLWAKIGTKADSAAIEAVQCQIQRISESKADRRESERKAKEIGASVQSIADAKADIAELARAQTAIENVARKLELLQESKADAAALQNFDSSLLRATETKAERHEVTALTNHLIALLEHRVTKNELEIVCSSMESANDAIEHVLKSKADISDLDELSAGIRRESLGAFEEVKNTVQGLVDTKADHAAITALRSEVSALEDSYNSAKVAFRDSITEIDRGLHSLGHSKADHAAITALRSEVSALEDSYNSAKVALRDSITEIDRGLHSLGHSKADHAAIAALRLELSTTLEDSSTAAGEALQASVSEFDRKLVSLGQEKADHAAITALRSEVSALEDSYNSAKVALRDSITETDRGLHSLGQSKADRADVATVKIEVNDALQRASSNWGNRFDQVVSEKADHALVEAKMAEANIAIMLKQKSAVDGLNSALALVNSRAHDLKRNVLDQDRRVSLLLEEARKRFPKAISAAQVGVMLTEDDHRLDAMYANFEDQFRGTRADIRQRQAIYLPYVREAKAGTENAPIIDIGCGRGEWLELLRDEGFVARGVDLNRVFLDGCRELNLDVAEQDALAYLRQLKRDSVGSVTSFHMIEHLDHKILISLLDETLRVLKPGGIVIFETPNPRNVIVGSCNFYLDPTHKRPLPPDLSRYLLEARGFSKVEVRELHPCGAEQMVSEGAQKVRDVLNHLLYSPQDYAVIGRKV